MTHHDDLTPHLDGLRADGFAPGFADRVMARLDRERADASAVLVRQFVRLVPAALAATLALAAVNWWHARDAERGLARAIGLPTATLASALTVAPESGQP